MTQKVLIVSGADEKFGDMQVDCVSSLRQVGYDGDIAILDFGLSAQHRDQLGRHAAQVRKVDMPDIYQQMIDAGTLVGPPGANVLLLKPYLPTLFPDHDIFVFVDADCWFQTGEAVTGLIDCACQADLAAVSQRSRFHPFDGERGGGVEFNAFGQPLRSNWYTMFANKSRLPRADRRLLAQVPIINAGVFSAHASSPVWELWQAEMLKAANALPKRRRYGADQLGLGMAVYKHGISHLLLPEICNWTNVWRYDADAGLFTETMPFYRPVSIMHLAGIRPDETVRQVTMADGLVTMMDLSYRSWRSRQEDRQPAQPMDTGMRRRNPDNGQSRDGT
ncbi:MAG: hypothetical protein ACON31_12115 [Candidatus Puniceispirillaceae bacterium]